MVDATDFERFDLILAMDRLNQVTLLERSPRQFHDRIRRFLEYASDADIQDVPDPYYGGANGFDQVLDLVEDAARGLLQELRRRARAG